MQMKRRSWHQHPGIGAYTIVKTGTLTVEDGCGGEVVHLPGTAFIEPPVVSTGGSPVTYLWRPCRPSGPGGVQVTQ